MARGIITALRSAAPPRITYNTEKDGVCLSSVEGIPDIMMIWVGTNEERLLGQLREKRLPPSGWGQEGIKVEAETGLIYMRDGGDPVLFFPAREA